jgi:mRNA-degrading endonuclease RelE of RelBE toxin-antitoxin system
MNFSVIASDKFKKEAKRLVKKYPSLKQELSELSDVLANQPTTGTPLGDNIYKIRLSIKSKGKGKSGGGRVITYALIKSKEVYLLTIYDKAEFESIDDGTLKAIIKSLNVG